ncbi:MAG: macro domain-containing protein [Lachnospiraceae bacterium]|nr:macro domain-containing protein [Lachnospiraceae bacterium]
MKGSNQGVDGAIHKSIDEIYGEAGFFKDYIYKELHTEDKGDNYIRCQRGEAVLTSGYELCKYVIHVVGAKYDGGEGKIKKCSSSAIRTLETCYYNIVKMAKEHTDIRNIAIPIISSGEYKIPFQTTVSIAIASVYNALAEWKRVVFQTSWEAHLHDWKEIIKYDEARGHFAGAKFVRELLMFLRSFFPVNALER